MNLGSAIKLIRTARGIKQKELASELRVSANYISMLEKGKREPSVSFLRAVADALKVPVGMFFMWQDLDASAGGNDNVKELGRVLVELQAIVARSQKKRAKRKKAA